MKILIVSRLPNKKPLSFLQLAQLNDELQRKDARIAALEARLQAQATSQQTAVSTTAVCKCRHISSCSSVADGADLPSARTLSCGSDLFVRNLSPIEETEATDLGLPPSESLQDRPVRRRDSMEVEQQKVRLHFC